MILVAYKSKMKKQLMILQKAMESLSNEIPMNWKCG